MTTGSDSFGFPSIGILTMCECSKSSMALDKMGTLDENQTPSQQVFTVTVGDNITEIAVPYKYDTISWVCGNAVDGQTYCGTDGTGGSADVSFTNDKGAVVSMPYEVFDWNGATFNVKATQKSQVGTHSINMHIRVAGYPDSDPRTWQFNATVNPACETPVTVETHASARVTQEVAIPLYAIVNPCGNEVMDIAVVSEQNFTVDV